MSGSLASVALEERVTEHVRERESVQKSKRVQKKKRDEVIDVDESLTQELFENTPKSTPEDKRKELGAAGEKAARVYLEQNGYDILATNWKCGFGEIDIVAMDDDAIVFIEVKTRSSTKNGFPEDAIGPKKRKRYERMAARFLSEIRPNGIVRVRFDAIAIIVFDSRHAFMRHHVNAFVSGE